MEYIYIYIFATCYVWFRTGIVSRDQILSKPGRVRVRSRYPTRCKILILIIPTPKKNKTKQNNLHNKVGLGSGKISSVYPMYDQNPAYKQKADYPIMRSRSEKV